MRSFDQQGKKNVAIYKLLRGIKGMLFLLEIYPFSYLSHVVTWAPISNKAFDLRHSFIHSHWNLLFCRHLAGLVLKRD